MDDERKGMYLEQGDSTRRMPLLKVLVGTFVVSDSWYAKSSR